MGRPKAKEAAITLKAPPAGGRGKPWMRDNFGKVRDALYESFGNVTKAAQDLGVNRSMLAQLCIDEDRFKRTLDDARAAYREAADYAMKKAILEGDTRMMVLYAKSELGYKENDGSGGNAPVQINLTWNDGSGKPEVEASHAEHEPVRELEAPQDAE